MTDNTTDQNLENQEPQEESKKPRRLSKQFMKNAGKIAAGAGAQILAMGAISMITKSALCTIGVIGLPAIPLVAGVMGVAMTWNRLRKDRNAMRAEGADVTMMELLKDDWKGYAKKWAVNSVLSGIGAGLMQGVFYAMSTFNVCETVSDTVSNWMGSDTPTTDSVDATTAAADTQASADTTADASDAAPAVELSAADTLIAALEAQECLDPCAQEILEGLKNGEAWALESAGTSALNGTNGIPCISVENATALIEQAAEMGNVNAQVDLAYYQYNGMYCYEMNQEAAVETINAIGQSWTGGEHLLNTGAEEIVKTIVTEEVTVQATDTATAAAETDFADAFGDMDTAETTEPAQPEVVGTCSVTPDDIVTCGQNIVMQANQSVNVYSVFGDVVKMPLDSGTANTQTFVENKLPLVKNIFYAGR